MNFLPSDIMQSIGILWCSLILELAVFKSSSMATPCSSANATEQFLFTDWNAFIPVEQNMEFNGSVNLSSCNAAPPQSDGGMVEQIGKPCFNNLSIHEMDCSFYLSAGSQIHGTFCTSDSNLSNNHFNERNIKAKKKKIAFEGGGLQLDSPSTKSSGAEEKKVESSSALRAQKSASKQAKEVSKDGDSPKEEFMHIRAKRGHATNSHSLAERVRREKISERMRVLQGLVPGCNKITGKAVMLDEIINYVQSLQRQVEFLSMKLAAVDPELKFELEQIFHQDVHLLRRDPGILGLGSGLGAQVRYFHGAGQIRPEMLMATTITQLFSNAQIPKIPNTWDDELQNAIQIGFIPHHPVHNSGSNGKDPKVS